MECTRLLETLSRPHNCKLNPHKDLLLIDLILTTQDKRMTVLMTDSERKLK